MAARGGSRQGRARDDTRVDLDRCNRDVGLASAIPAASQGMMQHVDLASPEMASAEMTRADVEAAIASATSRSPSISRAKSCPASTFRPRSSPVPSCAVRGSIRPNFAMQSSTERFSIKRGSWKPISAERASRTRTFLQRKCNVQRSMEPIFQARASRPTAFHVAARVASEVVPSVPDPKRHGTADPAGG